MFLYLQMSGGGACRENRGVIMSRTLFVFMSLLCLFETASLRAETNPDNACVLSSLRDSPTCIRFFEKINAVSATLKIVGSKASAEDVCEGLFQRDQIAYAEYSDCLRMLHDEISDASR